jgi:hypothetical protein
MAEISNFFIFLSSLLEWEHFLPIPLHGNDGSIASRRLIQRPVELADLRLPVAGVFAIRVDVMDDTGDAPALACRDAHAGPPSANRRDRDASAT